VPRQCCRGVLKGRSRPAARCRSFRGSRSVPNGARHLRRCSARLRRRSLSAMRRRRARCSPSSSPRGSAQPCSVCPRSRPGKRRRRRSRPGSFRQRKPSRAMTRIIPPSGFSPDVTLPTTSARSWTFSAGTRISYSWRWQLGRGSWSIAVGWFQADSRIPSSMHTASCSGRSTCARRRGFSQTTRRPTPNAVRRWMLFPPGWPRLSSNSNNAGRSCSRQPSPTPRPRRNTGRRARDCRRSRPASIA
jgi:hypothetical protein